MRCYFYPRSPCGERRQVAQTCRVKISISIHALLAESDEGANRLANAPPQLSIHALLAESDPLGTVSHNAGILFLSTLSLRRATGCQRPCERPTTNFYPRSPCGERPPKYRRILPRRSISIHALLAESDRPSITGYLFHAVFLSTLSLRRATCITITIIFTA